MRAMFTAFAIFAITFGTVLADPVQKTDSSLQQPESSLEDSIRNKRSYEQWLDIISQYARRDVDGGNTLQPFPVDLPVTGKDGKHTTLPLLVLPFPVPVKDPNAKQECSANNDRDSSNRLKGGNNRYKEDKYVGREDNSRYREDNNRYREENRFKEAGFKEDRYKEDRYKGAGYREDRYKEDRYKEAGDREDRYKEDRYKEDRYREDRNKEDKTKYNENRYTGDQIRYKENNRYDKSGYDVRFGGVSGLSQGYDSFEKKETTSVSSDYLVDIFKKQQPNAPELPPAVFDVVQEISFPSPSSASSGPRGFSSSNQRQYLPPSHDESFPPAPPQFDRSMVLSGFLTVYKSDYTEPYTAWYDARSGASRVEYHGGATTTYSSVMSDKRIKRSVITTDRTGERDVVVCGVTSPSRATPEDRNPPALPSTEGFTFSGFKEEFGVNAELWKHEVKGRPGELGAVRGESLVYHHELVVHRRADGFSMPLRYKVSMDSSLLGPNCDGYEHVYSEVREQEHSDKEFKFNADRQCDTREDLDAQNPEHMARLDPIREFTLPYRDPIHDTAFTSYTKEFERTYSDEKESAMRKTLLVQHSRFISSCNRQSATFSVAVNFLSDRLDEEVEHILGVAFTDDAENNTLNFPIKGVPLENAEKKLPKTFDWRPRGGVSPVKFQGASCSSCWAFAVVGSVEGALFIKTKRLIELSEQCLVDCGKSHGAHGCSKIGTWPVNAFNYVQDRGLPARDEYAPYDAMDHNCKAPPTPPVTHIQGGVDVPPENIDAMKLTIRRFAPTVVVVDALTQTFIHFKSGVLQDDRCIKKPKKKLNHAVVAVGWGERRGAPHFILKNSWSAAWGEAGYINVHAPSNTCGHLTTPSFALLRKNNIDRLPGGGGAGAAVGGADEDSEEDYDDDLR